MADKLRDQHLAAVGDAVTNALEVGVQPTEICHVIFTSLTQHPDWQTAFPKEDIKVYNSATLIEAAENYLKMNPIDVIQAGNKLWLSVCYAILIKFLERKIYLRSHKSLTEGYDFLMYCGHVGNYVAYKMYFNRWYNCEKLHKLGYGEKMTVQELKDSITMIKEIVSKIDSLNAMNFPIVQLRLERKTPELPVINFCGKDYAVEYDCF